MIHHGVMPDIFVLQRYKKRHYKGWKIEVVKLEDGKIYAQASNADMEPYTFYSIRAYVGYAVKEIENYIDKHELYGMAPGLMLPFYGR